MQGCFHKWLMGSACLGLLLLSGCRLLPGATAAQMACIPTRRANTLTLTLGDIATGFRLVTDNMPTNAQLAVQLDQPDDNATLNVLGRQTGTYRVFVFTAPEPSAINGITRATIEVDFFGTAQGAQQWFSERQGTLHDTIGPILTVAAPGQQHAVHLHLQHTGDYAVILATLSLTEHNVYVEITTTQVGPSLSIAEAERFADLIDMRLTKAVG